MSKSSVAVVATIVILLVSGLVVVNLVPVSHAYCSVWNYAGNGSAPSYSGCGGNSSSSSSISTAHGSSTTTTTSISSVKSTSTSSSPTSSSLSTISYSPTTTSTSNPATKATLSVSSNSIPVTLPVAQAADSNPIGVTLQTTGEVNLTTTGGPSGFGFELNMDSVAGISLVNGVYVITQSGTYQGTLTVYVPAETQSSTYTFSIVAMYLGQQIVNLPMSVVVGGGTSTYYCTEQNFAVNVTRAAINAGGSVAYSFPLDSVFSQAPNPYYPLIEYITTITANQIVPASGAFFVTYQLIGESSEISPNAQGQILASGNGWNLYQFEQQIPLSGGVFNVALNTTNLIQGFYDIANTATAATITSLNSYGVGYGTNVGSQVSLVKGFGVPDNTFVNIGVTIEGCNSQSSTLEAFTDLLSIPPAVTTTQTTSTFTVSVCLPHQPRTCMQSLVPLNLFSTPSLSILKFPSGSDAVLIGLADSLVLGGIALAVGTVVYYLKER